MSTSENSAGLAGSATSTPADACRSATAAGFDPEEAADALFDAAAVVSATRARQQQGDSRLLELAERSITRVAKQLAGIESSSGGAVAPASKVSQAIGSVHCAATAAMAGEMACEAGTVIEALNDLIGEGDSSATWLAAIRSSVARIGLMADTLSQAHGGIAWGNGAGHWLFVGFEGSSQAYKALEARAALKGGAA